MEIGDNVILTDPLGYKDFIRFMTNSKFVMTDSGESGRSSSFKCSLLNFKGQH